MEKCTNQLEDLFPHGRERVWLRGTRKDVLGGNFSLPKPLSSFEKGPVYLAELLDLEVPRAVEFATATGSALPRTLRI